MITFPNPKIHVNKEAKMLTIKWSDFSNIKFGKNNVVKVKGHTIKEFTHVHDEIVNIMLSRRSFKSVDGWWLVVEV